LLDFHEFASVIGVSIVIRIAATPPVPILASFAAPGVPHRRKRHWLTFLLNWPE
jgi:hypothetical protein